MESGSQAPKKILSLLVPGMVSHVILQQPSSIFSLSLWGKGGAGWRLSG